jgi:2'-5' RNA ligase
METAVMLFLADQDPTLASAHDELYPERVDEHIPLCITLLYPFVPRESLTEAHLETLRDFFAARRPFAFDLTRLAEFPGLVVYAVPEPDDELRATMRALWALFPDCPPYGEPGGDPPPHATLARLVGPYPRTFDEVAGGVEGLLPARFVASEATLNAEYEPDRWRVRATFPFGRPVTADLPDSARPGPI